jgi:cyclic dehypoxanthinyl futalosine synthase
MMFGSVETPKDIVEHLAVIRELQDRTGGFTAFIPWSFQSGNTELGRESGVGSHESSEKSRFSQEAGDGKEQSARATRRAHLSSGFRAATAVDYLRVLTVSRLFLDNIANIQASWVTQGLKLAQVALRFGANDFGSTMIEENVVRAAGVSYRVSMDDIINAIRAAGFRPAQRDTYYTRLKEF